MMYALVFAALLVASNALPVAEKTNLAQLTLLLNGGLPDVTFAAEISPSQSACNNNLRSFYPVLGYRGFRVATATSTVQVMGCLALERALFALAVDSGKLPTSVAVYVQSELVRLSQVDTSVAGPNADDHVAIGDALIPSDFTPVVGPDTVPAYSPATDDQGDFQTYCSMNNCYNYGSDIVTNTFAQPGRGSGKKWAVNTCENMNVSAIADGLQWVGTQLPTVAPEHGHYVALLIWPSTNFHWVRMDSNGMWSHKPGGTPVRNTDNNGSPISDPSKADLSPWTQFCGYMHVVPSKITIS